MSYLFSCVSRGKSVASLAAFTLLLVGLSASAGAQVLYSTDFGDPPYTAGSPPGGVDGWVNGSGSGAGLVISTDQAVAGTQSLQSDNSTLLSFYSIRRDLGGWTAASGEFLTVTVRLYIDPATEPNRLYSVLMGSSPTSTMGGNVLGLSIGGDGAVRAGTTWAQTYQNTGLIDTVTDHLGAWLTVELTYDPATDTKTASITGPFGTVDNSWVAQGSPPANLNLATDYFALSERTGTGYFDDLSIVQGDPDPGVDPELVISPPFGETIDFGTGEPGQVLSATINVSNDGGGTLELSCTISSDGGGVFSLAGGDPLNLEVPGGGQDDFDVLCSLPSLPGITGSFSGEMTCTTNDPEFPGDNVHGLACGVDSGPVLQVPTLSTWALLLLGLVLVLVAGFSLRRART